jgi:hypothetical protein
MRQDLTQVPYPFLLLAHFLTRCQMSIHESTPNSSNLELYDRSSLYLRMSEEEGEEGREGVLCFRKNARNPS